MLNYVQGDLPMHSTSTSEPASRHRVLELRATGGVSAYPEFQFFSDIPLPGLSRMPAVIFDAADAWAIAAWLAAPPSVLDGVTAADYLLAHGDDDKVLTIAHVVATYWSQ